MTEATYKFEYAIQRLRDAINYSEQVRDYTQIRIWVNHVEASYHADIASADEGLKLFHSIASNGEQSVLSRLDGGVDVQDAVNWQDEAIELAGRPDEAGGESVDVSQYFNGYKATATKEWRERHLNES